MKKMNYAFSTMEKILILILVLILIGLGYFYFIDKPVREGITKAEYDKEDLQVEFDALSIKIARLKKMQNELEDLEGSNASYMESYNANKRELSFLNDLLKRTIWYNVDFSDVSKEGDLIRRPFSLQFTTSNYGDAKKIINQLYNSKLRCLIADINITAVTNDFRDGDIQVALQAYFYETMNGGTPDAGLPPEPVTETTEETMVE